MSNFLNSFWRDRRGIAPIEFAFLIPVLAVMVVGIAEVGRVLYQANSVEKALRMGAVYAARNDVPLSVDAKTTIENLVKTGTADGSGPYLLEGWGKTGADLNIDDTQTFTVGPGTTIPVIRLTATVPFSPMLPGVDSLLGLSHYRISMSHEQAFLGN